MHENHELEASVLGASISHPDLRELLLEKVLHPLVFTKVEHQMMYLALAISELDADVMLISEQARRYTADSAHAALTMYSKWAASGEMSEASAEMLKGVRGVQSFDCDPDAPSTLFDCIGGFTGLAEMTQHGTKGGFDSRMKRLLDLYDARHLHQQLSSHINKIAELDAVDNLPAIREGCVNALTASTSHDDHVFDADSIVRGLFSGNRKEWECGAWGRGELDKIVPTPRNSCIVVAARPGVGKSSKAFQYARAASEALGNKPGSVAIAALEMTNEECMTAMLAQEAGVSFGDVQHGRWEEWQKDKARAGFKLWGKGITINDGMISDIDKICRWARAHKRRHPDMHTLIIDHINRLRPARGGMSEYETVTDAMNKITWLRKELDICILVLSQLNRENVKGGKSRPPCLADLRGSGAIEQDANVVIFLHSNPLDGTDGEKSGIRSGEYIIAKNRYGPPGKIPFTYWGNKGGKFTHPSVTHEMAKPDPNGLDGKYGNRMFAGEGQKPTVESMGAQVKCQAPSDDEDLIPY